MGIVRTVVIRHCNDEDTVKVGKGKTIHSTFNKQGPGGAKASGPIRETLEKNLPAMN